MRRHTALGPARYRQDADGRGGRGQRAGRTCSWNRGRSSTCLRRRLLKVKSRSGSGQARPPVRRGHCSSKGDRGNRGSLAQIGPGGAGGRGHDAVQHVLRWHGVPGRGDPLDAREERDAAQFSDASVAGAGMNGGGGGGGMGTRQALLTELSGLKKPRGWSPLGPAGARDAAEAAAEVPDPRDDGDQHAGGVDEARLRPGRIDRTDKVGDPSKVGGIRTYQGYFDKVLHEITPEQWASWRPSRRTRPVPRSRTW